MKDKTIFLIIWKAWNNYEILLFHSTKAAWEYVIDNKIQSYSIHWSRESISSQATSIQGTKDQIAQLQASIGKQNSNEARKE